MKDRRKTESCLNCGTELSHEYNYCPVCGQENTDNRVSFGSLIKEFFVNYFSLDSRLGNSIKPFLFKPGLLTNQFHEGKRLSFMNPVRLYIILSLFYFFVFTKAGQSLVRDDDNDGMIRSDGELTLDKVDGIGNNLNEDLSDLLDSSEIQAINQKLDDPNLEEFYSALSDSQAAKIYPLLKKAGIDSTTIFDPEKIKIAGNDNTSFTINKTDDKEFILSRIDFNLMNKLIKEEMSDQQIYDSLNVGEVNFFEELVVMQSIRINKADEEQVTAYILQNVPLMMFLLIPLFALILKLIYIRRNVLYIRHIVHAIHLHSFAYFIYGIATIFMFWVVSEDVGAFVALGAFLWVSIYAYISFRNVYKQHWFKTFIKFFVVGVVYLVFVQVFFLAELLISALLF